MIGLELRVLAGCWHLVGVVRYAGVRVTRWYHLDLLLCHCCFVLEFDIVLKDLLKLLWTRLEIPNQCYQVAEVLYIGALSDGGLNDIGLCLYSEHDQLLGSLVLVWVKLMNLLAGLCLLVVLVVLLYISLQVFFTRAVYLVAVQALVGLVLLFLSCCCLLLLLLFLHLIFLFLLSGRQVLLGLRPYRHRWLSFLLLDLDSRLDLLFFFYLYFCLFLLLLYYRIRHFRPLSLLLQLV